MPIRKPKKPEDKLRTLTMYESGIPRPQDNLNAATGHLMHFGGLLKHFRTLRGLTLRELAQLSAIDHAYIHRLETGQKKAPTARTVKALADALKLEQWQIDCLMWQSMFAHIQKYQDEMKTNKE